MVGPLNMWELMVPSLQDGHHVYPLGHESKVQRAGEIIKAVSRGCYFAKHAGAVSQILCDVCLASFTGHIYKDNCIYKQVQNPWQVNREASVGWEL